MTSWDLLWKIMSMYPALIPTAAVASISLFMIGSMFIWWAKNNLATVKHIDDLKAYLAEHYVRREDCSLMMNTPENGGAKTKHAASGN